MAAFGAAASGAAGGSVTSLDTANLNVTGSDLCLVVAVGEAASVQRAYTMVWDPAGNNESMTGEITDLNPGGYVGTEVEYLNDPTAANAPARATWAPGTDETIIMAAFFTNAADIVATDFATDSFNTTGSSLSATAPNVVSGDMVLDFFIGANQAAISAGANQTEVGADVDSGNYARGNMSYQSGNDGGVMSWTCAGQNYGAALVALRIPDSGGGGGGANPKNPLGLPISGPLGGPI